MGSTQLEAEKEEGLGIGRVLSWLQGDVEELGRPAQPTEGAQAMSGAPSAHRAGTSTWQPASALRADPAPFRVRHTLSAREQTLVKRRDVVISLPYSSTERDAEAHVYMCGYVHTWLCPLPNQNGAT